MDHLAPHVDVLALRRQAGGIMQHWMSEKGWRQRELREREARRIARYRAGLIIESVLEDGWAPDDLIRKFGPEAVDEIKNGLWWVAAWLIDTGHPEGTPGPYERTK